MSFRLAANRADFTDAVTLKNTLRHHLSRRKLVLSLKTDFNLMQKLNLINNVLERRSDFALKTKIGRSRIDEKGIKDRKEYRRLERIYKRSVYNKSGCLFRALSSKAVDKNSDQIT